MRRKLVALLVMGLAAFSTAALALAQEIDSNQVDKEAIEGIWIRFVGKAIPRERTDESRRVPLEVSGQAFVVGSRARGTMTVGETTYKMAARRNSEGVWTGVLTFEGTKVGAFKVRRVGNSKVLIGDLKLEGRNYRLVLRVAVPAGETPEAD